MQSPDDRAFIASLRVETTFPPAPVIMSGSDSGAEDSKNVRPRNTVLFRYFT